MAMQDTAGAAGRSLHFPITEYELNSELPGAAARAMRALVFDASGNAVVSSEAYQEPSALLSSASAASAAQIAAATPGIIGTAVGTADSHMADMIAGIQIPTFQAYAPTLLRDGVDYVSGSSTTVTLPATSSRKTIAGVFFDAAFQSSSQWTLGTDDRTLTFASAIPAGIGEINVTYYSPSLLGAFYQQGYGAVSRSFQSKMRDRGVCPEDFGGKPDGVTDCTLAINLAFAAAKLFKQPLVFNGGTYLTDTVYLGAPTYAQMPHIIGAGRIQTVLQKKTADGLPVMQIGTPTMTQYVGPIVVENIRFSGIPGDSVAAFRCYSLVRSTFRECVFENALDGCLSWGGISNAWERCTFQSNKRGWVCDGDPSLYGGGYPNLLSLIDCLLIENSQWGGYADRCRGIYVRGRDIEGNGTSGAPGNQGGFYIGINVNEEGADTPGFSNALAVCFEGCWFEANFGSASVLQMSGFCTIRDSIFVGNAATYDLQVEGGRYLLDGVDCESTKAANVFEDNVPNVAYGNQILNSRIPNITANTAKTLIHDTGHNGFVMRNGSVPVTNDFAAPYIQTGELTVNGTATVTFTVPFKAGTSPRMFSGLQSNNAGTLEQVEFYSISNTGFSVRVKSLTSGSSTIGTANRIVDWMAVGTTS
jgi:hypothetical protein